jgi:type I restriction enzyme S subunit
MQNSQKVTTNNFKNDGQEWVKDQLPNIVKLIMGQSPPSSSYNKKGLGLPFFQGNKDFGGKYPLITTYTTQEGKISDVGDVLISVRAPIGEVNLSPEKCCIGRGLAALRPSEKIDTLFLYYFTKTIRPYLENLGTGSTFKGITKQALENVEIEYPSNLSVQKELALKIEQLLSQQANAVNGVIKAKKLIERFRLSILSAAITGKLTKEWRRKNGKIYKDTWRLIKISDSAECLDRKRRPINSTERKERIGNIPYYGANGQVGWIDDFLFDDDLVIIVEDETFTDRIKPFSYLIHGKSWVNNHAHVLKPKNGYTAEYLNICFSYYDFTPLTSGTTGRRKLNQAALMNAKFMSAPSDEQIEIVKSVNKMLDYAILVEKQIEKAGNKADKLTQSILAKAFRGELI